MVFYCLFQFNCFPKNPPPVNNKKKKKTFLKNIKINALLNGNSKTGNIRETVEICTFFRASKTIRTFKYRTKRLRAT